MIWWAIFLFFTGIMLITVEFFVPGAICGTAGALALIVSCVMGCMTYPQYAVFIVIIEFLGAVAGAVLGLALFPHTPVGRAMILADTQNAEMGWVATEGDEALLGAEGEVYTPLRPAGTITIAGKRIDAVSDGSLIGKGARVRVTEVHGSRVVVEEIPAG